MSLSKVVTGLPDGRNPWIARVVVGVILAVALFCGLMMLSTFHGDPTIYLVYSKNIAAGRIFTFNPGQFSSGSTSPLWAILLAAGWLTPSPVLTAKLISLAFTIASILLVYHVLRRISGLALGASIATLFIAVHLMIPSALMYESALIVGLVCLLTLLTWRVIDDSSEIRVGVWVRLGFISAMIPLARPDAVILVVASATVIAGSLTSRRHYGALRAAAVTFCVSALPSVIYFGTSWVLLGSFSVSSYCRAFALREFAPRVFGVPYSALSLRFFLGSPVIIYTLAAAWGIHGLLRGNRRALGWLAMLGGFAYVGLFSLASPIGLGPIGTGIDRYVLPILPLGAMAAIVPLDNLATAAIRDRRYLVLLIAASVLLLFPLGTNALTAIHQSRRGLSFDVITEHDLVARFGRIAAVGSRALIYEVQDRYFLRPDIDVLSLDGITDGRVAPYLKSADIIGFLRRYRPRYWFANGVVDERPYLEKSILQRALHAAVGGNRDFEEQGLRFKVLLERKRPLIKGFAGCRYVFEIEYGET